MASAINVSTLNEYVEQKSDELLTKAVLGANTLKYIDVMLDVVYKAPLNYLDTTVVFQDGSICNWNPQGEDEFTQRFIETSPVAVQKEWCGKDLRKYWQNYQLQMAAGMVDVPFEEKLISENVKAINVELDKEIWQNDASALFPGIIYQLTSGDASTGVIDASLDTSAGIDYSEVIDAAYDNMPNTLFESDPVIFVSPTAYRGIIKSLNVVCCANRSEIDAASEYITYPGDSRVRIIPLSGLEGAKAGGKSVYAVASFAKNFVYGTDVNNSENIYKVWQDEKTDMTNFKVLFEAGTQVKFPDMVVLVTEA